jgi:hypothetical protein
MLEPLSWPIISDYQKWYQQGENLNTQAKQAMESRFPENRGQSVFTLDL